MKHKTRSLFLLVCAVAMQSICLLGRQQSLATYGLAATTGAGVATSLAAYIVFKKAERAYKNNRADQRKRIAYKRAKRFFRYASIATLLAGGATTASYMHHRLQWPTGPAPSVVSLQTKLTGVRTIGDLERVLAAYTYDELVAELRHDKHLVVQPHAQQTSYVARLALADGSVWYLKVAAKPGQKNNHAHAMPYTFGRAQNRSRYDTAQKINALGSAYVHAPQKRLVPLKNASAVNEDGDEAWDDTECVVLAPALPAGSMTAKELGKVAFAEALKTYFETHPDALPELWRILHTTGFADAHFDNIALLPHDQGLMIYDTEDVLQGADETAKYLSGNRGELLANEARMRRRKWLLTNFLKTKSWGIGLQDMALAPDHPFYDTMQELLAELKVLEASYAAVYQAATKDG